MKPLRISHRGNSMLGTGFMDGGGAVKANRALRAKTRCQQSRKPSGRGTEGPEPESGIMVEAGTLGGPPPRPSGRATARNAALLPSAKREARTLLPSISLQPEARERRKRISFSTVVLVR